MKPRCHPGSLVRHKTVPGIWQVWSLASQASRHVHPWSQAARDWQAATPGHTPGHWETWPVRELRSLQETS
jgi:hypothetical protein